MKQRTGANMSHVDFSTHSEKNISDTSTLSIQPGYDLFSSRVLEID